MPIYKGTVSHKTDGKTGQVREITAATDDKLIAAAFNCSRGFNPNTKMSSNGKVTMRELDPSIERQKYFDATEMVRINDLDYIRNNLIKIVHWSSLWFYMKEEHRSELEGKLGDIAPTVNLDSLNNKQGEVLTKAYFGMYEDDEAKQAIADNVKDGAAQKNFLDRVRNREGVKNDEVSAQNMFFDVTTEIKDLNCRKKGLLTVGCKVSRIKLVGSNSNALKSELRCRHAFGSFITDHKNELFLKHVEEIPFDTPRNAVDLSRHIADVRNAMRIVRKAVMKKLTGMLEGADLVGDYGVEQKDIDESFPRSVWYSKLMDELKLPKTEVGITVSSIDIETLKKYASDEMTSRELVLANNDTFAVKVKRAILERFEREEVYDNYTNRAIDELDTVETKKINPNHLYGKMNSVTANIVRAYAEDITQTNDAYELIDIYRSLNQNHDRLIIDSILKTSREHLEEWSTYDPDAELKKALKKLERNVRQNIKSVADGFDINDKWIEKWLNDNLQTFIDEFRKRNETEEDTESLITEVTAEATRKAGGDMLAYLNGQEDGDTSHKSVIEKVQQHARQKLSDRVGAFYRQKDVKAAIEASITKKFGYVDLEAYEMVMKAFKNLKTNLPDKYVDISLGDKAADELIMKNGGYDSQDAVSASVDKFVNSVRREFDAELEDIYDNSNNVFEDLINASHEKFISKLLKTAEETKETSFSLEFEKLYGLFKDRVNEQKSILGNLYNDEIHDAINDEIGRNAQEFALYAVKELFENKFRKFAIDNVKNFADGCEGMSENKVVDKVLNEAHIKLVEDNEAQCYALLTNAVEDFMSNMQLTLEKELKQYIFREVFTLLQKSFKLRTVVMSQRTEREVKESYHDELGFIDTDYRETVDRISAQCRLDPERYTDELNESVKSLSFSDNTDIKNIINGLADKYIARAQKFADTALYNECNALDNVLYTRYREVRHDAATRAEKTLQDYASVASLYTTAIDETITVFKKQIEGKFPSESVESWIKNGNITKAVQSELIQIFNSNSRDVSVRTDYNCAVENIKKSDCDTIAEKVKTQILTTLSTTYRFNNHIDSVAEQALAVFTDEMKHERNRRHERIASALHDYFTDDCFEDVLGNVNYIFIHNVKNLIPDDTVPGIFEKTAVQGVRRYANDLVNKVEAMLVKDAVNLIDSSVAEDDTDDESTEKEVIERLKEKIYDTVTTKSERSQRELIKDALDRFSEEYKDLIAKAQDMHTRNRAKYNCLAWVRYTNRPQCIKKLKDKFKALLKSKLAGFDSQSEAERAMAEAESSFNEQIDKYFDFSVVMKVLGDEIDNFLADYRSNDKLTSDDLESTTNVLKDKYQRGEFKSVGEDDNIVDFENKLLSWAKKACVNVFYNKVSENGNIDKDKVQGKCEAFINQVGHGLTFEQAVEKAVQSLVKTEQGHEPTADEKQIFREVYHEQAKDAFTNTYGTDSEAVSLLEQWVNRNLVKYTRQFEQACLSSTDSVTATIEEVGAEVYSDALDEFTSKRYGNDTTTPDLESKVPDHFSKMWKEFLNEKQVVADKFNKAYTKVTGERIANEESVIVIAGLLDDMRKVHNPKAEKYCADLNCYLDEQYGRNYCETTLHYPKVYDTAVDKMKDYAVDKAEESGIRRKKGAIMNLPVQTIVDYINGDIDTEGLGLED